MGEEGRTARLMELLFGEAAETAQRGASRRLRRWAGAFEQWLEALQAGFKPSSQRQALLAWRRLLRQSHQMPWELQKEDINQHAQWMLEDGYSSATVSNAIGYFEHFYGWCADHRVDPAGGPDFNPARGAVRPQIRRYAGATLLTRAEAERLLRTLRMDETPLGRRELAFFTARLTLGTPLRALRTLQWGQIEQEEEGGAWVRWRPEGERSRLSEETWEAMQGWLRASGRMEGILTVAYIFTPLREPGIPEGQEQREAWEEGRALSSSAILASLKIYG